MNRLFHAHAGSLDQGGPGDWGSMDPRPSMNVKSPPRKKLRMHPKRDRMALTAHPDGESLDTTPPSPRSWRPTDKTARMTASSKHQRSKRLRTQTNLGVTQDEVTSGPRSTDASTGLGDMSTQYFVEGDWPV